MIKQWRRLAVVAIGLGLMTGCYSQMEEGGGGGAYDDEAPAMEPSPWASPDGGGGGGGDWMDPEPEMTPTPTPDPDTVPLDETLDQPIR